MQHCESQKRRYHKNPQKFREYATSRRAAKQDIINLRSRERFAGLSETEKQKIRKANQQYHKKAFAALRALKELGIEIPQEKNK